MAKRDLDLQRTRSRGLDGGLKLVRRRPRCWTKRKIGRFIETLELTANVSEAARVCGMCRTSAYSLRRRDPEFRRDWELALVSALDVLADRVIEHALHGEIVNVRYGGKVVDQETRFDPKFALSLLKMHRDTALRVKAEADEVDGEALEQDLRRRLALIEARLNGRPEPGADEASCG